MTAVADDVRYAVRSLVRRPTLTVFAALMIALGVGSTTAIFGTLEAVILNPLPYDGADRMVTLVRRVGNTESFVSSPSRAQVEAWREQTDLFETVAEWSIRYMTLSALEEPVEIRAGLIRASFHDFVGHPPLIGRAFDAEEMTGSGAHVVMLGHGMWTTRFGADPGVLGQTVELDGEPWTVVGVMPKRTLLPVFGLVSVDVWRPLSDETMAQAAEAAGKLHEGVDLAVVNERLAALGDPGAESEGGPSWPGAAMRIDEQVGRGFGGPLALLMGAVVLLLLIACVNVSNLLLFRANARRRETAVRSALGGGPGRLTRQLMVESAMLALGGGALGVGLAVVGQDLIFALRPDRLDVLDHVTVNLRVLAFAISATLGTGLLFGAIPALQVRRADALEPLRGGARAGEEAVGGHVRWMLVTGEVALSFALLLGSLSIGTALVERQRTDVGYRADEVAVMQVTAPPWRYGSAEERRAVFDALRDRVGGLPGVRSVSIASGLPARSGVTFGTLEIEGSEPQQDTRVLHGPSIDEGYFAALGQRLVQGRPFDRTDLAGEARIAILGESTAREFFPDGDAVGRRFRLGGWGQGDWISVVGVAADVAMIGLSAGSRPLQMYHPARSHDETMMVLARAGGNVRADDLLPQLREIATATDRSLRIDRLVVADDLMRATLDRERFITTIMGVFAVLALVLAAVGIYGVVSQVVGQRTREIGIRMALGAKRGRIGSMVLGRAGGATGVGLVVGAVLATAGTAALESRVFGLDGTSPAIFAAAALVLVAVTILACFVPAARAMSVDPVTAIRKE